jgi:PAS domain S-box-containing protein
MNAKKISKTRFLRLTIVAGFALCCLVFITIYSHIKFQKSEISVEWSKHTLSVMGDLATVKTNVYELGASLRGFVITENPDHLKNYQSASDEVQLSLARLVKKISDNNHQVALAAELSGQVDRLLKYYKKMGDLVKSGQRNTAIDLVKSGEGQAMIDSARDLINVMKHIEEKLLTQRLEQEQTDRDSTDTINLVGSLSGITFVLFFIVLTYIEHIRGVNFQIELNENIQVQKALLNAAAFGLIATDPSGLITHTNPAADRLLGIPTEDLVGMKLVDLHSPEEIEQMRKLLSEQFKLSVAEGFNVLKFRADRGIIESDQWTMQRRDKAMLPVRLTVSPLKNNDDKTYGYIAVAMDVTKQVEFETTLIAAKEEALAGTKAKSEFLANMSHEIRTPMNAIMGMGELLKTTPLSGEQERYVEIFQNAGSSLLNLINDILDLSKIESGFFEIDHTPFQLSEILKRTLSLVSLKAEQKNLVLNVDVDRNIHDFFLGDANRLQQVLINILGNSIKFTSKGSINLKVHSRTLNSKGPVDIVFEITDTGIGMDQEQVGRLFQRFSQADSSITKKFGGTGLGLNISRKLVELMNGSIQVKSTLHSGTTFVVSIVLDAIEDDRTLLVSSSNLKSEVTRIDSKKPLQLLLVDDTEENRIVVKAFLKNEKHLLIDEARDGDEALRLCENKTYDLILMDMQMPIKDGYTATREIRNREEEQNKNYVPILAVSAFAMKEEIEKSMSVGCDSYLSKPISKASLLKRISELTLPFEVQIQEEMHELAVDYISSKNGEVKKLKSLLTEKDFSSLKKNGHKLFGSAGSYGFDGLSKIGQRIEEAAKAEDTYHLIEALSEYNLYLKLIRVKSVG